MKIQSLRLRNFTVFEDVELEFCGGINVLVGPNATGKSHVLKTLYSLLSSWPAESGEISRAANESFAVEVLNKLRSTFRCWGFPTQPSLKRQFARADDYSVDLKVADGQSYSELAMQIESRKIGWNFSGLVSASSPLFIPPREFLAAYEGFIAAYEKRELAFDETYKDLCVALSASRLKISPNQWSLDLAERIESQIGADIRLDNGRFYVGPHEAHLVAEGHRKLAMILQLLRNGGIEQNTTLFWDEPESGLNPILIKEIADLLIVLAEAGLQIFIATHDYLLTSTLSLAAEYKTTSADIRFFCLHRDDSQSPVEVESGDLLTDLEHEPIIEEFSKMYDREMELVQQMQSSAALSGVS